MPTGYTDAIKDGITFEEFAMRCARAFGACVSMRDDSTGKPIPKVFEPTTWHKDELTKAYKEMEKINGLSMATANKLAFEEFEQECQRIEETIIKDRELMGQYKDMLRQVRRWQPPTSEHIDFKKFMVKQIESSIAFDGMEIYYIEHPPKKLTGEEWLVEKKSKARRDIDYHTSEDAKEIDRVNGRNRWITDLRKSL